MEQYLPSKRSGDRERKEAKKKKDKGEEEVEEEEEGVEKGERTIKTNTITLK